MVCPAIEGVPDLGRIARPIVDGRYAGNRTGNGAGNFGTFTSSNNCGRQAVVRCAMVHPQAAAFAAESFLNSSRRSAQSCNSLIRCGQYLARL
jgi:hypothetical protein